MNDCMFTFDNIVRYYVYSANRSYYYQYSPVYKEWGYIRSSSSKLTGVWRVKKMH